jgi:predicted transcriptional regulator
MHRGEKIEKAVRASGIPISLLAKKLKLTRRTVYNIFEDPDAEIDIILQIGKIINYDFSKDFPKLIMKNYALLEDPQAEYGSKTIKELREEVEYWKGKYIHLLEEYNRILLKLTK